ncbi:MAG: dUTP diphosphatase [Candidatus Cloacimonetes bacterium]|nr:dUTP diphosphatase [Candidatus Cloacimonadota bacterium]
MIKVKIKKLNSRALIPERMTSNAAGYDIYSANSADISLKPGTLELVPTGIALSLPAGYEAQIRPRSGMAIDHQLGILNSPGTIDSDYRGEVKIILFNFSKDEYVLKPGTRIAQMVINHHETADFIEVKDLDKTRRGNGGFGHTSS